MKPRSSYSKTAFILLFSVFLVAAVTKAKSSLPDITLEQAKEINANNEEYQIKSPEEELLLTWFKVVEKSEANTFLNTTQIAVRLSEHAKLTITDSSVQKLGKALKKHNFLRLKKNGSFVYALYEKSYEEVDKEISEKDKDELIL